MTLSSTIQFLLLRKWLTLSNKEWLFGLKGDAILQSILLKTSKAIWMALESIKSESFCNSLFFFPTLGWSSLLLFLNFWLAYDWIDFFLLMMLALSFSMYPFSSF
ncbi:hypothetical protein RHMOL_Rhmol12G0169100 [Rhododendron molle]|nr:hypothetical protein RHMOL_Rhmol12G0169100 [Rhododendron molle]